MRLTPRLLASLGALTVTATAVSGLLLSPAAIAEEPPATSTTAHSLYAWTGEPSGNPDRIFEGYGCQPTEAEYQYWQVEGGGALEIWVAYSDTNCQTLTAFFDPNGAAELHENVGSVRRWF